MAIIKTVGVVGAGGGEPGRADRERAALGHGVQGVEDQIEHCAADHFSIGNERFHRRYFHARGDGLGRELWGQ
mgnify:CR=1 FL=1